MHFCIVDQELLSMNGMGGGSSSQILQVTFWMIVGKYKKQFRDNGGEIRHDCVGK